MNKERKFHFYKYVVKRHLNDIKASIESSSNTMERNYYYTRYAAQLSIYAETLNVQEKYLERAVNSVLNQTYQNFELILVDDKSPDRCGEICDKIENMHINVKVIHHEENKGLSAARNTGMKYATGQYIWFMDSDDYVQKTLLEKVYDSLEETLAEAQRSAEVTHNHPEGIKGAQAIAACVFLARTGKKKKEIKEYVSSTFGYDLGRTIEEIRPSYHIGANATCQGSVPEAIISFLDSTDYENAIRLAISIGGDSDTIACMAGGIAEAYYREIPDEIVNTVLDMLPQQMKEVIEEFSAKYYS